jgi:hypothetical protein
MSARVWVPQNVGNYDLTDAARYGEIVMLYPPDAQVVCSGTGAVDYVQSRLALHYREGDAVLLLGDPVLCTILASVAADLSAGRVTLLKWDRRARQYSPILINYRGAGGRFGRA